MGVPISQVWTVSSYMIRQRLSGRKQYPLVLMLEPIFRCNLACAGCGKVQYPAHILKREVPFDDCMKAVEECAAPIVSILGGEPLLHTEMDRIVAELVRRRKYVYLCTNAILLGEHLDEYEPSKYLSFSVHLDGLEDHHDFVVCREGVYKQAREAVREAVRRGFRVTTNTTLFEGADPAAVREFFDEMMEIGVEGMMVSPGYAYSKAPHQDSFLHRSETNRLFRMILSNRDGGKRKWRFNQSPLFLEFLMGMKHFECTPWGNPTYNLFGWQRPCYLLQDGYADTYQELIDETDWSNYGESSGNPKCANCMVHCGHEPSAVASTFSGIRGFVDTIRAVFRRNYRNTDAARELEIEMARPHGPIVQLGLDEHLMPIPHVEKDASTEAPAVDPVAVA